MSSLEWPTCCLWTMSDSAKTVQRPAMRTGGLVVQKAPGAGGADGIHAEVRDHPIPEDDNLAVLAADFNDGLNVGDKMEGPNGMGCYLVLYRIRPRHHPRQVAGTAGSSRPRHLHPRGKHLLDKSQALLDGLNGPSLSAQINAGQDLLLLIQGHHLGGDGAYINT